MFKPGRWWGEKNRPVKALFKLQFLATQVPEIGADALVVSAVPADGGKLPVRSDEARIRDGQCQWEIPIYESLVFTRDPWTGRINRKVYRFIVTEASARAGSVGEASIDIAEYAEATKASSVSFPLKNSNNSAVLHISIQRMEENDDLSPLEGNEDTYTKFEDRNSVPQPSIVKKHESMSSNFTETEKSNGYGRASSGSDLTSSTTSDGSSSGLNTPRDLGTRHGSNEQQDPASFLSLLSYASVPKSPASEMNSKAFQDNGKPQWEWTFDQKLKTDDTGERNDSDVKRLKDELSAMARKMDVSEMELQTMRRQITKESRRSQELAKEVDELREERDSLKEENRTLLAFKSLFDESRTKNSPSSDGGNLRAILEEVRQEVNYEKELNMNLRLQLQKTQESNEELLLAVRDLDEMLEEKNQEIFELSSRLKIPEKGKVDTDEEDQKVLEELVREHKAVKDPNHDDANLAEVYKELEACRRVKDELEMQMEQLALDYEILKQENHEISNKLQQSELQEQLKAHCDCTPGFDLETRVEALEKNLEEKSKEFSDSVAKINELEFHAKNLEEELDSREKEFESNLEEITKERIKQEKRAIRAEEFLRKMQLRNADTVERLQEEFRRLSTQMATVFEENEKAAVGAMKEASELRKEKCRVEELLAKADEEIRSVRKTCDERVHKLLGDIEAKQELVESLKGDILKLKEENAILIEQAKRNGELREELGRLEGEISESEAAKKRRDDDRNELLETVNLLKEEREEKEATIQRLESMLETVKTKLSNLEGSVLDKESEKEILRKQVSQLKIELQKKEDVITRSERRSVSTGRAAVSNGMKTPQRNIRSAATVSPSTPGIKELSSLKEKIKFLEEKIALKEAELQASASSYREKEKDMQSQIDELESRLKEQNQIVSSMNTSHTEAEIENVIHSAQELRRELDALEAESEILKERNMSIEMELKDLQERYSEMSVRFAEVEGERQQLVMTLRNENPRKWF